ncbi:MAG: ribonucleoside triphosphate reductase, partial [Candidatus Hodarchaeota archaeon]
DNVSFIRQNIQNLICAVNQTSRWGGQSPFVNLSFDWIVPEDLANQTVIIAGKPHLDILYQDCQTEIDIFNKIFIEEMLRGDSHNRIFTFPIPTYSLTKNFNWNHPNVELLMKMTSKYGIPYFQNYSGSNLEPSSIRAMCCRLNLNILELKNRPGGMWNIGDSTGSIGVVTINMNRLGYLAINQDDFFRLLRKYMDLAKMSLEIKRKEVTRNLENGMMSYAKEYLPHGFKTYFSTIGLCGMHECCLNFLNKGINSPEGLKFAKKILLFMRDVCEEYKAETGNLYNLEATPAESTSYRFARLDRKWYPNVILSGTDDVPYITNSTHLPVGATLDIIDAIEHQDELQPLYTGGTIFHSFLGEEIDPKICMNIVRTIAEKTRLPYFSITPTFSICTEHKYIKGKHFECPICGKQTEVYSRIVGYFRPISKWNDGKTQEFNERKVFKIGKSSLSDMQDLTSQTNSSDETVSDLVGEVPRSTAASAKPTNGTYIALFISETCPKCRPFKAQISNRVNPSKIKTINTATEEGIRLAEVFNITKVPTAIILDNDKEYFRFSSVKGMNKFLPDLKRHFGNNEFN